MRSARPVRRKRAVAERNRQLAGHLDMGGGHLAVALALEVGEPGGDALIARPPERARLGIIVERGKMRAADADELAIGVRRQAVRIALGELSDRGMDRGAAVGGARRLVDRGRAGAA